MAYVPDFPDFNGNIESVKCSFGSNPFYGTYEYHVDFTFNSVPHKLVFDLDGKCSELFGVNVYYSKDGEGSQSFMYTHFHGDLDFDVPVIKQSFNNLKLEMFSDSRLRSSCTFTFTGVDGKLLVYFYNSHNGYYPHMVILTSGEDTIFKTFL